MTAAVRIGGTAMLTEFFAEARGVRAAELTVLAPFVDRRAFDYLGSIWSEVVLYARTQVLVRTLDAARAVLKAAPPLARIEVRLEPSLHAKVFVAWQPTGRVLALIGSHNLTGAGLEDNLEAGVLLSADAEPDSRRLVGAARDLAGRAFRSGRPAADMVDAAVAGALPVGTATPNRSQSQNPAVQVEHDLGSLSALARVGGRHRR